MQELIYFSAFLYQYIESFAFLKVARRGGYSPSKSATGYTHINTYACTCTHTNTDIHTYTHKYRQIDRHRHGHTNTHTHRYTDTHTHTNTHTQHTEYLIGSINCYQTAPYIVHSHIVTEIYMYIIVYVGHVFT